MKLYEMWQNLCEQHGEEPARTAFWQGYYQVETEAYKIILAQKSFAITGTAAEAAEKLGLENAILAGFLDGANTSFEKGLTEEELKELEDTTPLSLTLLPEKLYYNMLNARAKWLYTLPEWEGVLSAEKRKEITRVWRNDNMATSQKVGRNDPCTCGSGKKYKNCCGA